MNDQKEEHILTISEIETPTGEFLDKYVLTEWQPVLAIILSALLIYISLIISTRIAGKRSFSKMSSFDFAITISIGSIIAATILNQSVKISHGIIGLATIFIMQMVLAHLRKNKSVQTLIDNKPLLLMKGSELLRENMYKAHVTESDIRGKLREANVIRLDQVKAVIFESTGDISVLHSEDDHEVEEFIICDVQQ